MIEPNILWKKDGEAKSLQSVRAIKPYQKNVEEAVIIQDNNPIKYKLLESAYDREYCKISLVDEDGNLIHTWYDSYGRPPDEEIIKKFGQGSTTASDDQNQEFGTTYCGQLALYFLYRINNSDTLEEIIIGVEKCQ